MTHILEDLTTIKNLRSINSFIFFDRDDPWVLPVRWETLEKPAPGPGMVAKTLVKWYGRLQLPTNLNWCVFAGFLVDINWWWNPHIPMVKIHFLRAVRISDRRRAFNEEGRGGSWTIPGERGPVAFLEGWKRVQVKTPCDLLVGF